MIIRRTVFSFVIDRRDNLSPNDKTKQLCISRRTEKERQKEDRHSSTHLKFKVYGNCAKCKVQMSIKQISNFHRLLPCAQFTCVSYELHWRYRARAHYRAHSLTKMCQPIATQNAHDVTDYYEYCLYRTSKQNSNISQDLPTANAVSRINFTQLKLL